MYRHGPTCLEGPLTRKRPCWRELAAEADAPEIRADLVARVRREIAEGTYETPEKLQAALERLLDDLQDS